MAMETSEAYKQHRIHTSRLFSGVWVASIVAPGGGVEHIRGEFRDQESALQAARELIDRQMEQDHGGEAP
jgi:hypothetical protein